MDAIIHELQTLDLQDNLASDGTFSPATPSFTKGDRVESDQFPVILPGTNKRERFKLLVASHTGMSSWISAQATLAVTSSIGLPSTWSCCLSRLRPRHPLSPYLTK